MESPTHFLDPVKLAVPHLLRLFPARLLGQLVPWASLVRVSCARRFHCSWPCGAVPADFLTATDTAPCCSSSLCWLPRPQSQFCLLSGDWAASALQPCPLNCLQEASRRCGPGIAASVSSAERSLPSCGPASFFNSLN